MIVYKKEITVYDFEDIFDGFCVEVHREKETIELYLYHKNYGIKDLMFGLRSKDIESEAQLRNIIASNLENSIEAYRMDFMDN